MKREKIMAKNRKRVFPKKVPRLTEATAKLLGKNSNKCGYEASLEAIYYSDKQPEPKLSPQQEKMLSNLKKNLSLTYQK